MSEFEGYLAELRSHLSDLAPRRADEIIAEARTYLESRAAQLRARGTEDDEATADAVASFGDPEQVARDLLRSNTRYRRRVALRGVGALAIALGSSVAVARLINSPIVRDSVIAGIIVPVTGMGWGPAVSLLEYATLVPMSILVGIVGGRRFWWLATCPFILAMARFVVRVLYYLPAHLSGVVEIQWQPHLIWLVVHAVPLGAVLASMGWFSSRVIPRRSAAVVAALCASIVAALWLGSLLTAWAGADDLGKALAYGLPMLALLLVAGLRDRRLSRRAFQTAMVVVWVVGLLLVSFGAVLPSVGTTGYALVWLCVAAVECIVGVLVTLIYWMRGREGDLS